MNPPDIPDDVIFAFSFNRPEGKVNMTGNINPVLALRLLQDIVLSLRRDGAPPGEVEDSKEVDDAVTDVSD